MPATRSRTENWRQCLQDLYQKGGALEITLPRYAEQASAEDQSSGDHANLIWRVRVIGLSDREIVVEQPVALGHAIQLQPNIELVGLIAIGQNRWMFRTVNLGEGVVPSGDGRSSRGYRLKMPDSVERCQRRNFYRISTIGLTLPRVDTSPVLDVASAALAEASNRCQILDMLDRHVAACPVNPGQCVLPELGPSVQGTLVNIGGGGVGLLYEPSEPANFDATQMYWLRINLQPLIPAPLAVSARLKHTHMDSSQRVYAGMAFEFGHSHGHEKFVVDQLLRYVAQLQRDQLKRAVAA